MALGRRIADGDAPGDRPAGARGRDGVPPPVQRRFTRLILGPPLPSWVESDERLGKGAALAVLSSDALSSVAYATEEMVKVLIPVVGLGAFTLGVPIGATIIVLLVLLVFSYRQTIAAYPNAGGAYIVTRDNFGLLPAQAAGVALLLDYIMTVAVSVAAGIAALYSYFPALFAIRVPLAVTAIWMIAFANLRGLRSSGRAFSVPTYAFLLGVGALLTAGVIRAASSGLHPLPPPPGLPPATTAVGILLLMHAYASGTTALTGVEAISNGVTVFRPPEVRNARTVLLVMGGILTASFGGITLLAWRLHPVPTAKRTVISELGAALFGRSGAGRAALLGLQITTTAILVLAANTSFSDFPRLASFHAADGYLPSPLRRRGPRLAFSYGIVALAAIATAVVVLLRADVHRLIPLYAVGVFASFTFSQAGMTRRHLRRREPGWRKGLAFNALGAAGSAIALVAVLISKFTHGAWVVTILIPLGVALFVRIHDHYERVGRVLSDPSCAESVPASIRAVVVSDDEQIQQVATAWARAVLGGPVSVIGRRLAKRSSARWRAGRAGRPHTLTVYVLPRPPARGPGPADPFVRRLARLEGAAVAVLTVPLAPPGPGVNHAIVVLADTADARIRAALRIASRLHTTETRAVRVDVDAEDTERVVTAWSSVGRGVPLNVLPAPYREHGGPVTSAVRALQQAGHDLVTVIAPALTLRWWQRALYHDPTRSIMRATASVPGTAVLRLEVRLPDSRQQPAGHQELDESRTVLTRRPKQDRR